ncbi:MAG: hypothetical protein EOS10_22295 [Mesorhizobium sp.]|uniref:hypothetical protein n=1 Tax=Mesorhizobium sp. TaxID=1871066 RepID=UPI000FE5B4A8|nr:hypothetical protein [Mesorhizobium sp.]RWO29578.1 MAG: hypothetical protein EOS10_22295 [Mesorhizobium sp.]
MRTVKKGAAGQSIYFDVLDSASSTGGRKTGLVFNTASLTAYYVRNQNTATAITLATLAAANTAWSSGGFKEVDATNMPGIYRLDVPDAAFATGADSVAITIKGASGMVQASYDIQLVDNVESDTYARLGAPVGASISADVAAVKAVLPSALVSGRIDASVGAMAAAVLTATAIAADAITDAKVASDVTIASVTGAVGSVSGNVGGNVTGSVGSVAAGGITAASFAADSITAAKLAADVTTELQAGLATASSVATLQTSVDDLPTNAELATALAGADDATLAAIAALNNLSAAQVNAEVDTAIADAALATAANLATVAGYLDTEVAAILADTNELQTDWANGGRLDLILDARASQTSVDDLPTNAELATALAAADDAVLAQVAMVKAKTDNLPDDPADQSLVVAATDAVMSRLGAPAGASLSADIAAVKTDTAAVKSKTDSLTFTVAGKVDANITHVNETAVTGTGETGDEWGPG